MFLSDLAKFNKFRKDEDRTNRNRKLLLTAGGVGLLGVGGYLTLKGKKKNLTATKTPSSIPQKQPGNPTTIPNNVKNSNIPQPVQSRNSVPQPKSNTAKSVYLAVPNDGFSIARLKDPDYLYEKTQYMRVGENDINAKRKYSSIVRKQGKPKPVTEKNQFRYLKLDVDEMDNLDSLNPRVNQTDRIRAFRELMRKNPKIRVSGTVNDKLLLDQGLYHR